MRQIAIALLTSLFFLTPSFPTKGGTQTYNVTFLGENTWPVSLNNHGSVLLGTNCYDGEYWHSEYGIWSTNGLQLLSLPGDILNFIPSRLTDNQQVFGIGSWYDENSIFHTFGFYHFEGQTTLFTNGFTPQYAWANGDLGGIYTTESGEQHAALMLQGQQWLLSEPISGSQSGLFGGNTNGVFITTVRTPDWQSWSYIYSDLTNPPISLTNFFDAEQSYCTLFDNGINESGNMLAMLNAESLFLIQGGVVHAIDPPGFAYLEWASLNNNNDVLFYGQKAGYTGGDGGIYRQGEYYTLTTPPGISLQGASVINDQGWILGGGTFGDQSGCLLLIPNLPPTSEITNCPATISSPLTTVGIEASDDDAVTAVTLYVAGQPVSQSSSTPFDLPFLWASNGVFNVCAVASDALGLTGTSSVFQVTVDMPVGELPAMPTNPHVQAWSATTNVVSWDSATNVTLYRVDRITSEGTSCIGWLNSTQTYFIDTEAPASGTLSYYVTALNPAGYATAEVSLPTITFSSLTENQIIPWTTTTIPINLTASGETGIAEVVAFIGDYSITNLSDSLSTNVALPLGDHTLVALASDANGNSRVSELHFHYMSPPNEPYVGFYSEPSFQNIWWGETIADGAILERVTAEATNVLATFAGSSAWYSDNFPIGLMEQVSYRVTLTNIVGATTTTLTIPYVTVLSPTNQGHVCQGSSTLLHLEATASEEVSYITPTATWSPQYGATYEEALDTTTLGEHAIQFQITTVSGFSRSLPPLTYFVDEAPALEAPLNLTCVALSAETNHLTWASTTGATAIVITCIQNGETNILGSVEGDATTFTDGGAPGEGPLAYQVTATNATGSATASVTLPVIQFIGITNLQVYTNTTILAQVMATNEVPILALGLQVGQQAFTNSSDLLATNITLVNGANELKAWAIDTNGNSRIRTLTILAYLDAPEMPADIHSIGLGVGTNQLTWTALTNANSIRVDRTTEAGTEAIATLEGQVTAFLDSTAPSSGALSYTVVAGNLAGESASTLTLPTLSFPGITNGQQFAWDATVPATVISSNLPLSQLSLTTALCSLTNQGPLVYTNITLPAGTNQITALAIDTNANSRFGGLSVIVASRPPPPPAPQLRAEDIGGIGLYWQAFTNADQIRIERTTNGITHTITTLAGTATSFVDTNATRYGTLSYKATVWNAFGTNETQLTMPNATINLFGITNQQNIAYGVPIHITITAESPLTVNRMYVAGPNVWVYTNTFETNVVLTPGGKGIYVWMLDTQNNHRMSPVTYVFVQPPLLQPTGLHSEAISSTSNQISWFSVTNASGYSISRITANETNVIGSLANSNFVTVTATTNGDTISYSYTTEPALLSFIDSYAPASGAVTYQVTATNEIAIPASASISPPIVEIQSPSDRQYVACDTVTPIRVVASGTGITNVAAIVGGSQVLATNVSTLDGTAMLLPGWHTIEVLAQDEVGNSRRATIRVFGTLLPRLLDSDADGIPDSQDAFPYDPTRWTAGNPDPSDTTPPTITLTEP